MKKAFLFLLGLTLMVSTSIAQYAYNLGWEFYQAKYTPIDYTPTKNVDQINFTVVNKKGKITRYTKEYNEAGKITCLSKFNKEGVSEPMVGYKYNDVDKVTEAKKYKKGQPRDTYSMKYNSFGREIEKTKTNKKGVLVYRHTWEYNPDSTLATHIRYNSDGKIVSRWEYEYYSKREMKRSTLYNRRGKVKKIWSYECKSEGEILEKRKNETQVCRWDESSKDFLIKVYQSFDEKGRIRKYVTKYNAADTSIVSRKTYNGNDRLQWETTYDGSYNKCLSSIGYDKKGREKFKYLYTYAGDQTLTSTGFRKGKQTWRHEYTYENELLTEYKSKNKDGKIIRKITLTYGKVMAEK